MLCLPANVDDFTAAGLSADGVAPRPDPAPQVSLTSRGTPGRVSVWCGKHCAYEDAKPTSIKTCIPKPGRAKSLNKNTNSADAPIEIYSLLLLQAICTQWGSDPMFYGSYSSVSVGSGGAADYDILARPLGDKVFFAGEATTSRSVEWCEVCSCS